MRTGQRKIAALGPRRGLLPGLHLGYEPSSALEHSREISAGLLTVGAGLGCAMDGGRGRKLGLFSLEKQGPRWDLGGCGCCLLLQGDCTKGGARLSYDHT